MSLTTLGKEEVERAVDVPRGLRNRWRVSAYEMAVLLLVLTLILGLRAWMTLPNGLML